MTEFRNAPDLKVEPSGADDSYGFHVDLYVGPQWKKGFIMIGGTDRESVMLNYEEAEMLRDWLNRALQPRSAEGAQ